VAVCHAFLIYNIKYLLTFLKFGGILYLVKIGLVEETAPFLPKKVIIMEGEIC
jgi:hypothetical protein